VNLVYGVGQTEELPDVEDLPAAYTSDDGLRYLDLELGSSVDELGCCTVCADNWRSDCKRLILKGR